MKNARQEAINTLEATMDRILAGDHNGARQMYEDAAPTIIPQREAAGADCVKLFAQLGAYLHGTQDVFLPEVRRKLRALTDRAA